MPALTAGIANQGLNCYVPREGATILENVISISANGANTGATFYQREQFTILQDAYAIKWIYSENKLSDNQYLFLTSSISNTIYGNYEWTNKAGWEKVKFDTIQLPIKNGKIDFDFMESFIAELETKRIAELEAYLLTTGLKDYTLTKEERTILTEYEDIEWREFKLGDLFKVVNTKKLPFKAEDLPKQPTGKYILPCLTSSFKNQGLNYYAPEKESSVLKNVISIPSNSDIYRAYFQSSEFTVLSDAYVIRWSYNDAELSPEQYLFMVQCINKVTDLSIYSYKNKLGGWNVVKNKSIQLPVKNNNPDYSVMETFMLAIKKLHMKNIVLYTDRKIKAVDQIEI